MQLRRRRTRKKVVATVRRRECIYKRTGTPSVSSYEKGGMAKKVTNFLRKKIGTSVTCSDMEAPPRFELGVKVLQTSALPLGYGATY